MKWYDMVLIVLMATGSTGGLVALMILLKEFWKVVFKEGDNDE